MDCRPGCGACCTAPSITSPIPGMPQGKPAGIRCVQLDNDARCRVFGRPERPAVCASLAPSAEMCGPDRVHAMAWLLRLEAQTQPPATP
ncbi:YkgJ family cysteine cluster protein [Rubrivivax rivuli]|uniref:YkgJ family cysteine cluster protein n=1 Tax=Rubrivivax rivuli TaxID=1862385 RepID=A0A437RRN6_9BURK|nr:YkgJ family cysteine cluster protein [Rubrivivax rivuli]RVU49450.1 YkgJ family cysteine cluster protein [Rubrivivax rivuli]